MLLQSAFLELIVHRLPPFEWFDKVPVRSDYNAAGVGAIPPATVRFGAHVKATPS